MPPIQIEMLYFAAVRERTGKAREAFSLDDAATLSTLQTALLARYPDLVPLLPHVRWARNEAFVATGDLDVPLQEGDRVALIPPVSGGAPRVGLTSLPLDAREVEALVAGPDRGGVVTFTGCVRDHTGEHGVVRLEYEAYAEMAERVMDAIVGEAEALHPGARVAIRHRLGVLGVGELAVVIAASAPHRAAAFEACRFTIERLKADVPIFKKEVRTSGEVWVGLGP
jgi:molybdopterin synthase catalytic subunit